MSLVLYIGKDKSSITTIDKALVHADFTEISTDELTQARLRAANMIILSGAPSRNNVQLAEKVRSLDSDIAITILETPENFDSTKRAIRFSAFIGQYTYCYTDKPETVPEIQKILTQSEQRKSFTKIRSSINLDTLTKPAVLHIEQLGNFLEQAPIGAVLLDHNQYVVAINPVAKLIFNWTPEIRGILPKLSDLFPETEIKQIIDTITDLSIKKKVIEFESENKILEFNIAEVANESGQQYHILLISDITVRKREDQRIRTILNVLPQMGWITDTTGKVTYLTEGWFNYTGQQRDQSGNDWLDYIFADDQSGVVEKWERCLPSGRMFEHEARYKNYTGEYRWHLVRAVPILNEEQRIDYWLGIATDIEAQKRVEKDLETQVQERTLQLTAANTHLQKSNDSLKEFAHIASHDLQEPLRKVRVFASRIEQDLTDETKVQDYLNKIKASAERMSNLISGILSHSNLSASDKDFVEVDLNDVLTNILSDFDLLITERKAVIVSQPLPIVRGVKLQLVQLFSNLISNSLKYCIADPVITISCKNVTQETALNKQLQPDIIYKELLFKDNGIGFAQESAENIFTIFSRLHGKTEYLGTGIGLALCKKIVDNHHGFINAVSESGQGAAFYIYLPI